uniref:Uncharacterized protein n=1 Tax=Aggregatibacter actinomycetemcomitans TaxID=714 RepID=S4W8W7_AGGAC|nr:hypothetical protein pS23A_0018 [Aggregatibacter actinomycetemcomitans]
MLPQGQNTLRPNIYWVTVCNQFKKFAHVLIKVKPSGLATPNLDNHPQILNGLAYRYPLICAKARYKQKVR